MKKRLISMLLALLAVMGLLPTAAFAASTPEEALGEVQIYNGGVEMSYLSINGRIRSQIYTYYNYDMSGLFLTAWPPFSKPLSHTPVGRWFLFLKEFLRALFSGFTACALRWSSISQILFWKFFRWISAISVRWLRSQTIF